MATMGFIKVDETPTLNDKTSSIIVPETFTHSIAFGETGAGKTSSYIYPNLKNRIALGHGILLYDYKGKEHLSVKYLAKKAGRLDDVIEIGKPWGESINIIQKMDEDELDKFFNNILKHGKDGQYWQNSAKSLGQTILHVLKGIESFADALEVVDGVKREKIVVGLSSYPTKRTLQSLLNICKTFEMIKEFVKGLRKLIKTMDKLIQEAAQKRLSLDPLDKKLKLQLSRLISTKVKLESIIELNQNSLDSFGEDSNENLTQNIMGSLTSPLVGLSKNESFNTNNFDIVSALNEGKIIVINVESLANSEMESLSNTILYELSKRTKSKFVNPVSVFIDEFQRVVSANSDIPIDIFREAKVDMFLATQNSALLKDKLEDEKFDALMGNLTQKFYYKSSLDEELESLNELKLLQGFEYLASSDDFTKVQQGKPIFIDESHKMLVEFEYQKSLGVLEEYLYKYKNASVIVDYDARLYKENKLVVFDMKTKKEYILESLNKENIEFLEDEVKKLLTIAQAKVEMQESDKEKSYEDFLAS